MSNWAIPAGTWRSVPLRINLSLVLGVLAFSFIHFSWQSMVGVLGLVVLQAIARVISVRLVGARVTGLELHFSGARCGWEGEVTPIGRSIIASGALAAQLIVLVLVMASWSLGVGLPTWVIEIGVWINGAMVLVNLIPLDGGDAWSLPFRLGRGLRQRLKNRESFVAAETPGQTTEAHARALAKKLIDDARKDVP